MHNLSLKGVWLKHMVSETKHPQAKMAAFKWYTLSDAWTNKCHADEWECWQTDLKHEPLKCSSRYPWIVTFLDISCLSSALMSSSLCCLPCVDRFIPRPRSLSSSNSLQLQLTDSSSPFRIKYQPAVTLHSSRRLALQFSTVTKTFNTWVTFKKKNFSHSEHNSFYHCFGT